MDALVWSRFTIQIPAETAEEARAKVKNTFLKSRIIETRFGEKVVPPRYEKNGRYTVIFEADPSEVQVFAVTQRLKGTEPQKSKRK